MGEHAHVEEHDGDFDKRGGDRERNAEGEGELEVDDLPLFLDVPGVAAHSSCDPCQRNDVAGNDEDLT